MDACAIHANPDKINDIDNDDYDIIHVGDIHPNHHQAQNLIIIPDLSDDNHVYNKGEKFENDEDVELDNDDLSDNDHNDNDDKDNNTNQACVVCYNEEPSQEDNETEDQGVRRSRCKYREVTDKYAN